MITKQFICANCNSPATRTDFPSRFKIGQDLYCSKKCAMIGAARKYRPAQEFVITNDGHIFVRKPEHPNCNKNHQIPLAVLIVEEALGRYLQENELVHHRDLNPGNNALDNLELMTISNHVKLHNLLKRRKNNGQFIPSN